MEKIIFILATLLLISTMIHAVAFQTQSFKDYLPYRYFISLISIVPFILSMILHVAFNITDKSVNYALMCNLFSGAAVICIYNESTLIRSDFKGIKAYRLICSLFAMFVPAISLYVIFKYIYAGVHICTS